MPTELTPSHPTTSARDLYEAILREPAEDLPRLIYAEEIEPYEPERSDFIRTQIADSSEIQCHASPCCTIPFRGHAIGFNLGMVGKFVIRRGFVDSVAMTMRQFMGEDCPVCTNESVSETMNELGRQIGRMLTCPRCHGSGLTPGLASVICARWPVMSVTFSDKRPHIDNESGMYEFGRGNEFPSELPEELLAVMRKITGQTSGHLFFETESAAQLALSHAAVAYARELAGLPPLKYANSTQPVAV